MMRYGSVKVDDHSEWWRKYKSDSKHMSVESMLLLKSGNMKRHYETKRTHFAGSYN